MVKAGQSEDCRALLDWSSYVVNHFWQSCCYASDLDNFLVKPFIRYFLISWLFNMFILLYLSFSDRLLSVCLPVTFFTHTTSPKPLGHFQPNLTQSIFEWTNNLQIRTFHFSPNQYFGIIIVLCRCVYWFELWWVMWSIDLVFWGFF